MIESQLTKTTHWKPAPSNIIFALRVFNVKHEIEKRKKEMIHKNYHLDWLLKCAGVSHPFVAQVKPNEVETITTSTVTGSDGKQYPATRTPRNVTHDDHKENLITASIQKKKTPGTQKNPSTKKYSIKKLHDR